MLDDIVTDEIEERLNGEGEFEDQWPLVIFTGHGPPSVEGVTAFHDVLDGIFALKKRFALISDMQDMEIPCHEVRKLLGRYQGRRQEKFSRYLMADAHVIGSKLIRGLVTVINWISPPVQPQGFFKTMKEAQEWCHLKLGAQISTPDPLVTLRPDGSGPDSRATKRDRRRYSRPLTHTPTLPPRYRHRPRSGGVVDGYVGSTKNLTDILSGQGRRRHRDRDRG